jgi:hypothetical protein
VNNFAFPIEENCEIGNILTPVERALLVLTGASANCSPLRADQVLFGGGHEFSCPVVSWAETPDLLRSLARNGYGHMHRFAVLPSRTKARWLLPQIRGHERVDGFQIYTPFSPAARLMKALTVRMRSTGWHGWVPHTVLIASKKPLPIEILASEITGETNLIFSLALGTPGTFQKLTVQVMRRDGAILGYFKMPLTDSAGERLQREAEILGKLSAFPKIRSHIPRLLFAGHWLGKPIVFQSPLSGEKGPATLTESHERFLDKLQSCYTVRLDGPALVRETARRWEREALRLGAKWQNLGREVLRIATRGLNSSVIPGGIHHGDFTPWNTRMVRDHLAAFDWECAGWNLPNLWDRFHFLAQTECVLRIKPAAKTRTDVFEKNRSLYLLYLLSSTAQMSEENAKQYAIDYRERQIMEHLAPASAALTN